MSFSGYSLAARQQAMLVQNEKKLPSNKKHCNFRKDFFYGLLLVLFLSIIISFVSWGFRNGNFVNFFSKMKSKFRYSAISEEGEDIVEYNEDPAEYESNDYGSITLIEADSSKTRTSSEHEAAKDEENHIENKAPTRVNSQYTTEEDMVLAHSPNETTPLIQGQNTSSPERSPESSPSHVGPFTTNDEQQLIYTPRQEHQKNLAGQLFLGIDGLVHAGLALYRDISISKSDSVINSKDKTSDYHESSLP